jgi:hypothetical protein
MRYARRLVASLLLAAAAIPALADEKSDACRKTVTRDCVLEAAERAADKVQQPFWRANVLAYVAVAQHRFGLEAAAAATLERAEQAAKQIPPDSKDGADAPGFAAARAEMGDWTGAAAYAQGVQNPSAKVSALAALAIVEQRHGRADEAKAHFALAVEAAQAEDVARRAGLLALVGRSQAKAGLTDAATTFDIAIAAAKATGRRSATDPIIYQRIDAGEFERAFVDISDLKPEDRGFALHRLAAAMAKAGRYDQAAIVASTISDNNYSTWALTDLATVDFRVGRNFEGALMLVRAAEIGESQQTQEGKDEAKAEIAGAEATGGMMVRANGHIAEARAALAAQTEDTFRKALSHALALALARAGDTDGGLAVLRPIAGAVTDAYLLEIADNLEAAHRPGEAFAALDALSSDTIRSLQLLDFAARLPN